MVCEGLLVNKEDTEMTEHEYTVERVYIEDSTKIYWAVMRADQQFPISDYYEDIDDARDMRDWLTTGDAV